MMNEGFIETPLPHHIRQDKSTLKNCYSIPLFLQGKNGHSVTRYIFYFEKSQLIFLSWFRTRMHATSYNDSAHCAAYLLRHLRKFLLLAAVSHNPDAVRACMHLSAIQHHPEKARTYSTGDDILRHHEEEHGNVGLNVQLTMEDLERLHFWLQPPSGGGVDDPPIKMGDFIWHHLYTTPPHEGASIPLGDVEKEVRRHLELELLISHDQDDKDDISTDDEADITASSLSNLSLSDASSDKTQRARQPQQGYQKELTYTQLRGTTILLKPNSHYTEPNGPSSAISVASGDQNAGPFSGRLHDLVITDCSDVHMYLLQPFEHVTIAGCTGCTVVVGAVAGLLHIMDSEKTSITSAARRILVSNSCDVLQCVFTPSPPLLVGDNRNCQFAPYNTYYDGLREDLLAAGMAAAVVPESQSPYHGNRPVDDAAWPPLQCASNKWKQPIELSKLEIPQVAPPGGASAGVSTSTASGASTSPGADDKAAPDSTMHTPVLLPASEFNVLFVPLESESMRVRRLEAEEGQYSSGDDPKPQESLYCRLLAEVLQLSPFHLPLEYERHALVKADRIRNIKQMAKKNLTEEQQIRFEEELNRGFRDWLVTSGNLRQVLDLVHMEKRQTGS
jgi:TBCC domain-containing protein 1